VYVLMRIFTLMECHLLEEVVVRVHPAELVPQEQLAQQAHLVIQAVLQEPRVSQAIQEPLVFKALQA
jgi:hypothetical protein